MDGRWRKAVLAWAVGLAVLGGAGPALAAEPDPNDQNWQGFEVAGRLGMAGAATQRPHVRVEARYDDLHFDFDYGAVRRAHPLAGYWGPPDLANPGHLFRLGAALSPQPWFTVGVRAMAEADYVESHADPASYGPAEFVPGFASWILIGPPGLQAYLGVNDGGLAAMPLGGPRFGLRTATHWRQLAARMELAAGYVKSDWEGQSVLQGAAVLAHPLASPRWLGEVALAAALGSKEKYLLVSFGARWSAPVQPDRQGAERALASETAYVPAASDTWLGRETTWLHRPSGLPQTCTVTEAAAMEDMTWLYQTCTPGPADAIMPWATGCYVLDHLGLWRLPTCPGEAPGKLTRPLLLVPSRGAADPRFVDLNDATWQRRVLKLEGRNVQVECQRVPGLQTYEACMSPQEGLLFASVRATLAADRKRWPARSTELVQWRTVEVAPGSSHFGDEVSQCHWSSACRVLGECRDQGGRCVAQRDDDCAPAAVCAIRGACGAVAGRCAPKTAAMCESSENCRRLGQCQLGKVIGAPACVAADDLACQAAEVCAAQGLCRAERGRCVAGGVVPGAELPAEVTPVTAPR